MIHKKNSEQAPLITDPSTIGFNTLSEEKKIKNTEKIHVTHVTCDMRQVLGGEQSVKISTPQLLRPGRDSVLKKFPQPMTELVN